MTSGHISPSFRLLLLAGVAIYLITILFMIKKRRLSVRYAIIWLFSAGIFSIFALFPYLVLVLRDLTQVENSANFVFLLVIAFLLLVCLSLSSIISEQADKIRRMAQQQALLEQRVRNLENNHNNR